MISRTFSLITILLVFTSCGSNPSKPPPSISKIKPQSNDAPQIKALRDLGGLELIAGQSIPEHLSDKRYSPGEWLMLEARGLGVESLYIDDIAVNVEWYFDGNPIFRLPSGLSPRKEHQLRLSNNGADASMQFNSSHFIVATDTDGKRVHLVRTNPRHEGGVEEDWIELDDKLARPMFAVVSNDSRFLFVINIADKKEENVFSGTHAYILEAHVYHLAAPNKPKRIKVMEFDIDSSPVDAYVNERNELLIAGVRSYSVVDVSDALNPALKAKASLPALGEKTVYVDALFFNNNQNIAFLETYQNSVVVVENAPELNYPVVETLALLPNKSIPLVVDLERDARDESSFWVLEGPNLRLAGKSVKNMYRRIFKSESAAPNEQLVHQLQRVTLESDRLILGSSIATPEGYMSHFAHALDNGDLLVSTTKLDFIQTEFAEKDNRNALGRLSSFLWDKVAVGRVFQVNTETAEVRSEASGLGIYYDLT